MPLQLRNHPVVSTTSIAPPISLFLSLCLSTILEFSKKITPDTKEQVFVYLHWDAVLGCWTVLEEIFNLQTSRDGVGCYYAAAAAAEAEASRTNDYHLIARVMLTEFTSPRLTEHRRVLSKQLLYTHSRHQKQSLMRQFSMWSAKTCRILIYIVMFYIHDSAV